MAGILSKLFKRKKKVPPPEEKPKKTSKDWETAKTKDTYSRLSDALTEDEIKLRRKIWR